MRKKSQSPAVILWTLFLVALLPALWALDADADELLAVSDCGGRFLERSGENLIVRSADGFARFVLHSEALKEAPPLARPSGPDDRSGDGDGVQEQIEWTLVQVAELNGADHILAGPDPIDLDRDGRYEIIFQEGDSWEWEENLRIYECTGDNTFSMVHEIYPGEGTLLIPAQVTDGDADGLTEILVYGRTHNDFWVRTYEQTDQLEYPSTYPFELVPYDNWWPSHVEINDLDGDGSKEISYSKQSHSGYFAVHENIADDSYTEVFSTSGMGKSGMGIQRYTAGHDFDEDGKQEILMGGFPYLFLYENKGDDEYRRVWKREIGSNTVKFVDTNDIDRDGQKDFLLVAFPPLPSPGCDFSLYEQVAGSLRFRVAWTHFEGTGFFAECDAAIGDLDTDGRNEIVTQMVDSTFNRVTVFDVIGDDRLLPVWSRETTIPSTQALSTAVAIADLDKDGQGELFFTDYVESSDTVQTLVFEVESTSCFISAALSKE